MLYSTKHKAASVKAIIYTHAHAGEIKLWRVTTSTISGNSQSSKPQNNCSQCLVLPSWISLFFSITHSPADSYHVFHETAFWVGDLLTQEENKRMTTVVPSPQGRRLDVLLDVHSSYTALLLQHKVKYKVKNYYSTKKVYRMFLPYNSENLL